MPPRDSNVGHLTCWYWATRGYCIYSDDVCLYAHSHTGRLAEEPRAREPGAPAVAGANATRMRPIYHNWRRIYGLPPRSPEGALPSPQRQFYGLPPRSPANAVPPPQRQYLTHRQSLPSDSHLRPNYPIRNNWRSESSISHLAVEEAAAGPSQTSEATSPGVNKPQQSGQRPRALILERDQDATREEYTTGFEAIAEFLDVMQANAIIFDTNEFPLQTEMIKRFGERVRYREALRARIDREDDRTMNLNHVMARLKLPPVNPSAILVAIGDLLQERDRAERSLRGIFSWAILFLEDVREMRRTLHPESELYAVWGHSRVRDHYGVAKMLLGKLDSVEGNIRRLFGGA